MAAAYSGYSGPDERAQAAPVTWLRDAALVARGGRLIARPLAVRPPTPASA
jgi:hypothetical protein